MCKQVGVPVLLVYSPITARCSPWSKIEAGYSLEYAKSATDSMSRLGNATMCANRAYFDNSQRLNADGGAFFSEDLARRFVESGILASMRDP